MTTESQSDLILKSEIGQSWFSQFDPEEKDLVIEIVDNLKLVSQSEFTQGMKFLLSENIKCDYPSALFAIRIIGKDEIYFSTIPTKESQVNALKEGSGHGSEAIISQLINGHCKSNRGTSFDHPEISIMREAKCRKIYLIDDIVGSGTRVIKFIKKLKKNSTILSWLSLKYVSISVICYTCTEAALNRIKKFDKNIEVIYQMECPIVSSIFLSNEAQLEVNEVLKKYAKFSDSNFWGGFRRTCAMLLFEHSCPNNVPGMFWNSGKNGTWQPLFNERAITADHGSLFLDIGLYKDVMRNLEKLSESELSVRGKKIIKDSNFEELLIILELCKQRKRKKSILSFYTSMSRKNVDKLIEKCIDWNLITTNLQLTKRGLDELLFVRRYNNQYNFEIEKGPISHFPITLRGP